jgi:hypothetical protein
MYSEIAAKESCTSTASTIAPPDAVIRPQHTLDQPRRGGDHARLDSPGMPPGPPIRRDPAGRETRAGARSPGALCCPCGAGIHRLGSSGGITTSHARRSKVKSPTMRPTGRACHQLVPRWQDGTRDPRARP